MWLSLLPHVLQPATLPDAGACGVGLRKHAARSADLRCARARQAYGSRPAPRVVHACTRRKTCLVPVVVRAQSERNPAQARGCCSRGFGESTWRRWRARTPARSNRPARSCPCDTMPLQKPARARPLAQGHPFWPSAGEPSLLGYRTEAAAALGRSSGAGPKSPIPLPLAVQVRGVVRCACRASPRAGGVAGSRVHAQQRRSEHRVAVRSGRRVRGVNYSVNQLAGRGGRSLSLVLPFYRKSSLPVGK